MLKQVGFLFNADLCVGCKACEIACKNENQTAEGIEWRRTVTLEEGFLSISCNHCESPECFRVCPNKAYRKRRDGVVHMNPNLCDGCRTCVTACPYHAPQYDPVKHKTTKCNYCLPRREKGLLPACVLACPTGALNIIDLSQVKESQMLRTIPGFPDIRLTNPSIRFYPLKPKKRYWLNRQRPI